MSRLGLQLGSLRILGALATLASRLGGLKEIGVHSFGYMGTSAHVASRLGCPTHLR